MALRRNLFEELIREFHPRTLPDSHHTFDDALTAFMITSIGPSEKSVESSLQYWLMFLEFIVQKLDLRMDAPHLGEEDKEERRRLWWAAYIIDRHSSLSFNSRPVITDQECHQLPVPCSDSIWDQTGPLSAGQNETSYEADILNYAVRSLDMFGVFIPLSRQIFQRSSVKIRTIEGNLRLWFVSFQSLVGPDFVQLAEVESETSALHSCEHANACAKMAQRILRVDPHLSLMYRYYGTYFLQSCFIFLILAQKLGRQSDSLIISNCAINLEVLDKFILTTNMDYQHDFARLLRKVLSDLVQHPVSEEFELQENIQPSLDPEMLRYRWIPGFKGLLPNLSRVE
ncbi:hypothetical protein ZTR_02723 [Talaromyces verruculosus]|nr:hypothetical protein ZTR_02723 [Talaromyces verruculosus]